LKWNEKLPLTLGFIQGLTNQNLMSIGGMITFIFFATVLEILLTL